MPLLWIELLRVALQDEFGDRPRIATLATVAGDGTPRARSVVVRGIDDDDGTQWMASDARSEKNGQIRAGGFAEIVFWLPSRRLQFRLRGAAMIVSDEGSRQAMWEELSDATRATFSWPAPGAPYAEAPDAFPRLVGSEAEPPASFELIAVRPEVVEALDLTVHPHQRTRWTAGAGEERLNP